MRRIPSRYAHFVFGVIQSGLTSAIAAGIASLTFLSAGTFFTHWIGSWFISWIVMLPIVVLAAPVIRKITMYLTADEAPSA
ncbi:MAG: DUF2798 domain-containing protein [Xanthobacteraceae bacterium]|nr:DUF2798 domain-containing protein [Xanthobacteraceae bacterium]